MTGTEREDRLALADDLKRIASSMIDGKNRRTITKAITVLRLSPVMDGMREALGQLKAGHWAVGSWFGGDFCENPKATKQVIEALHGRRRPSVVAAHSAPHPQAREPQSPVGHYTGRPIT